MFGWLKRKKPTPPEEDKAFKLGRQAVQSLANDLDAFVKIRFDPVFENFIEILRTSVQKCFQRDEAPPLTLARIEYDIFNENIGKMKARMIGEINQTLGDWRNVFEQMDAASEMDKLINHKADQFCTNLSLNGLKLLMDYAEGLKDADVIWRKTNPLKGNNILELTHGT